MNKLPNKQDVKVKVGKWIPTVVTGTVLGLAIAAFALSLYLKKEALVYAYFNPNKIAWLQEADKKVQEDGQLKLKESISRVFINEVEAEVK